MDTVKELVGRVVCVVTLEGRSFVGKLLGYDALCNIVLTEAHERIFYLDRGMEKDTLGLYLIRADCLCVTPSRLARAPLLPAHHTLLPAVASWARLTSSWMPRWTGSRQEERHYKQSFLGFNDRRSR
jgi:small nuclear ribonucleoprotein (snRNP)-like protein